MSKWIDLDMEERRVILRTVSEGKSIDPESVEKDWWVTMVLKAGT